jgi:G3E family GTPase
MSAPPAAPLPVILLTGFLGSGKTTLLLRWLREAPATGLRVGIVMNEFGAESVDSQLISRPGLPLQQVSGGCVCCAPDNELPDAVLRLVQEGACDYLVVETSGLADPDNVIDVLTDPELLRWVRLQAVVTVVDGPWFSRPRMETGERILARRQIQFAHVLCLSKCDRLGDAEVEFACQQLAEINPHTAPVKLPWALPEPGGILARTGAQTEIHPERPDPEAAHLHTTFQSLAWRFPAPIERSRFEAFLSGLNPREVIRAKGFVRFRHAPAKLFLFQSVFGQHLIEEFTPSPAPDCVAVLIGPALDLAAHRDRLRGLLSVGGVLPLVAH